MNEYNYWPKSVFITLTYDDEHLPADHSLHVEELQKFFKRLRKNYGEKIRYFACGEYGEKVRTFFDIKGQGEALGRPHYHAIVFGLGNDTFSKDCVKKSWKNCNWSMFQDSKVFGSVTYDSCRYVSDYIFKKYDSEKGKEVYGERHSPFKVGSNGLGKSYLDEYAEQLKTQQFIMLRGHKVNLPRYYRLKLGIKDTIGQRYERGLDTIQKWKNYCKRYHKDCNSIAYYIAEMRKQREINTLRNAQIHRKGDL